MSLPHERGVEIPRRKVTGYLLALGHPVGGAKARYFLSRGFSLEAPDVFEEALREVAESGLVKGTKATEWGTKYFVVGEVVAPDGNAVVLGTVWIVAGDARPILVTAYPTRRDTE